MSAPHPMIQEIQPALLHRPRHGRTQSTTPSLYSPDSSPSSTSYRGAGGNIVDDGQAVRYSLEDSALASASTTPTRQPLGQRLLSAVSNAQPSAAGLNRSKSVLHSRAKSSFAAFVSKASANANAPEEAPQQSPQQHTRPQNRLFGDLFSGESAPVRLGIPPSSPTKEDREDPFSMPEYKPTFTERPAAWLKRQSTTQTANTTSTTTTTTPTKSESKTSWWPKRASAAPQPQPRPAPASPIRDEITDMNIHTVLFPNGPADNCSSTAFNELLTNATALLERTQSAYREKCEYIANMQPELDEQREVLEASRTQSRLLKEQLDAMSLRSQEQDTAMREMAAQIATEKEKSARAMEAVEASRTIRPVSPCRDQGCECAAGDGEDDDNTPRRRKRTSAGSHHGSDSGFESDVDVDNASLASRAVSPNGSGQQTPLPPPAVAMTISEYRGGDVQRHGTVRRPEEKGPAVSARTTGAGSQDWAVVEQLKGENLVLKREKMEMQRELQLAIDSIGNLRL